MPSCNPEPLLARSHYSPSRAKKISMQQKKLALSPVRFRPFASSPEPPPQTTSLSLEDQRFLEGSHRVVNCPIPSVKEHQGFSESWPSTGLASRASAGASPCTEPQPPQHQYRATSEMQEPSVLAKYIERFRYGRPQSREERQRLATGQPFWWTSSSPPQSFSSTPTQTPKERFRGLFDCGNDLADSIHSPAEWSQRNTLSPTRGLLDLSVLALSESSHCEPGEPEILQLQERASRLLQKSENSLSSGSSGVPISSEGLGCSDFSSPVTADEPVRTPIVPSLMDSNLLSTPSVSGGDLFAAPSAHGTRGSRIRPEDDILFQWRLRRKMEQARQLPETSSHSTAFHQPLLSRLALQPHPASTDPPQKAGFSFTPVPVETGPVSTPAACPALQPALPVSSATICKLQPETSIPTHHNSITCSGSVLFPQPARERAILEPQAPHSLQQACLCVQGNYSESSVEPCSKPQTASSQSPQPSENTDGEWHGRPYGENILAKAKTRQGLENGMKTGATSSRKKKSDRYVGGEKGVERKQRIAKPSSRHGRGQERVSCKAKESSPENKWHSGGQSSTGGVRSGDRAPPPSPIHNTLGQVVSEVLFPATDSPTQSRTPCSSDSPRYTPPAPSQSPVPAQQSMPQPSEVIGQLMQEAQDSDGLEFEDDPLLLVLRQQRTWVKEQLCEVDRMLEELCED
ncbi:proline and serine-rich protein 3 isoform X2 [Colossoma macropomum]|uniref:proline and serine-rich protein 3 isoform X2 n=1 Tax=Colossoma macropomum TaxID=42526 RepID=UPI001863BF48|nr:proline and serine-rich protein 3 isoform X2 [Colossoma macropomum]